ncbi:MAG TPA: cyclic nucleotide-binding domain-containing protein [Acidimicrobiia bacterium]|nr:cyclic nucleotide-binding domain-containing protein [Acidimicrobiia bacterium]
MSRRTFAAELARAPIFSGMTDDELRWVTRLAVRAREPAGAELICEGERGNEFLVVLEGTVEVRHGGRAVATLGPGDHLGEIALVDEHGRRTATAFATTPVTIAYLGRHEFTRLLTESPAFERAIGAAMATRVAELEERE